MSNPQCRQIMVSGGSSGRAQNGQWRTSSAPLITPYGRAGWPATVSSSSSAACGGFFGGGSSSLNGIGAFGAAGAAGLATAGGAGTLKAVWQFLHRIVLPANSGGTLRPFLQLGQATSNGAGMRPSSGVRAAVGPDAAE